MSPCAGRLEIDTVTLYLAFSLFTSSVTPEMATSSGRLTVWLLGLAARYRPSAASIDHKRRRGGYTVYLKAKNGRPALE